MKNSRLHSAWTPWIFLAPFLLSFTAFIGWPAVRSLMLAFEQTFGPRTTAFVGLTNFRFMLHDPFFWTAVGNTVLFTVAAVVTQIPAALGLALLLNRADLRGRRLFRVIFFAPSIVGLAFVAIIYSIMLEKRTGFINSSLHALLPAWDPDFPWLEHYVMPSLILAVLWLSAGFYMVYFLAALQNVPGELLDAANIDGASPWQRFRHVTLPEIRPVLNIILLLVVTGSFQLFELPYLLYNETNGNGPDNQALTIVTYLYQTGFRSGDLGYASAIGWLLTLVLVGLALLQRRLTQKEEL
ncbi:MAG: lactose/L-arabinose transport system permease protein [Verrucomicrobia bacterium]|jgi:ABC-type sugar transport system permease subunit|nr:MAG: lactose/L-arabinose transport system permease protein [Verrucomicrobiota bacterium]